MVKWLAALTGIAGAWMTAYGDVHLISLAFAFWLVSSILWIISALRDHEASLFVMSVVYAFIDILGLIHWLHH